MHLIHGVGYNDGKYPSKIEGKRVRSYEIWVGMIKRCYQLENTDRYASYRGCSVSDKFKSYSYFHQWYMSQVGSKGECFELEKDLLVKGNRVYCEENCILLPRELNVLLQLKKSQRGRSVIGVSYIKRRNRFLAQISMNGKSKTIGYYKNEIDAYYAYKFHKESYIKTLAEKWKSHIDPRAYDALMNYQVEITD